MHNLFVFMDRFTRPILPPLLVEKDCGKYMIDGGTTGRVLLISGDFDSIFKFIDSHEQIWLAFQDNSTEEDIHLEKWVKEQ